MKIIIMDEVDDEPWTAEPQTYAVKGGEYVRLKSATAHERLTWMAKGYEIRTMKPWEAAKLVCSLIPINPRKIDPKNTAP